MAEYPNLHSAASTLLTAAIHSYNELGLISELDTELNSPEQYRAAVEEIVSGVGQMLRAAIREAAGE